MGFKYYVYNGFELISHVRDVWRSGNSGKREQLKVRSADVILGKWLALHNSPWSVASSCPAHVVVAIFHNSTEW